MNIISKITLFIFILFMLSCEELPIKVDRYSSGKVKSKYYGTDKKLDSILEYYENTQTLKMRVKDISANEQYRIYYDESGKDKVEGWYKVKNNKLIREGWWLQVKDGVKGKVEYITVGDTTKYNRIYVFNLDGSINYDKSHYYQINLPDTIDVDRPYKFTVELISPVLGAKGTYITALKLSDEITPDYLNFWQAKGMYDIKELKTNQWEVNHVFTQKGDFTIYGFIWRAFIVSESLPNDMVGIDNRKDIIYIKKDIYVK